MAERVFLFPRGAEQQPSLGHKDNYTNLQFLPADGGVSHMTNITCYPYDDVYGIEYCPQYQ
jgi:hypothetical protein